MPSFSQPQRGRLGIHPRNPPLKHGGGWRNLDYPSAEQRAANLAELLGLSSEQKDKVQALLTEQDKQSNEIWEEKSLSQEERTRKLDVLRAETVKQIRLLLTDEQRKKYDAIDKSAAPAAEKK